MCHAAEILDCLVQQGPNARHPVPNPRLNLLIHFLPRARGVLTYEIPRIYALFTVLARSERTEH
jgi:hypothetical protein